jgi:geranylgeranyl diphosphate synthase type I
MNKALTNFIGKYKEGVDREIAGELERRLAEVSEISPHLVPVLQAMKELSVGGKRLRAMLVILGWQLTGAKTAPLREIIRAGVVMELFHLGLLIQDDFMDRDMTRRGVKTLIARYDDPHTGDFISMLAGDYTFGWGIENLSNLKMDANRVNAAMAVWGKYFTRVGYGQTLDGLDIADDEIILKILAIKSGEYSCVLPLLLGATLGGADKELLDRLEKYGMELGWVFQLRDDYLGYDKDMAKKGKKTYATMKGREKTLEAIMEHMMIGKDLLRGFSSKYGELFEELIVWVGTRKN